MTAEHDEKDLHERILAAIDSGDYPPGARLLEAELAARFGVSRTPVREALRRLETQGVVQHEPRKGAVVAALDYNQIGELYAVREVMEGLAARLAAHHASKPEIALLYDMIESDEALSDPFEVSQANKRFHRQLHLSSHNRYLIETLAPISTFSFASGGDDLHREGPDQNVKHRTSPNH